MNERKKIEKPKIELTDKLIPEQKIKFMILCALEVYKEPVFVRWAENWLDNKDRTKATACEVRDSLPYMGIFADTYEKAEICKWARRAAYCACNNVIDSKYSFADPYDAVQAKKDIDLDEIIEEAKK